MAQAFTQDREVLVQGPREEATSHSQRVLKTLPDSEFRRPMRSGSAGGMEEASQGKPLEP